MNYILGSTLVDKHENRDDVLHSLECLHSCLNTIGCRLERIEHHFGLPPMQTIAQQKAKTPIQITVSDSEPLEYSLISLLYMLYPITICSEYILG